MGARELTEELTILLDECLREAEGRLQYRVCFREVPVCAADGKVDLGDLARTMFILGMDTKTLCSEDCKGLCPGCGADLNLGPCSCKKEADPRLAVLAKLLENK